MSAINLLEIVPDKLFQDHFVTEIDAVQKKLHNEIERKREDLRAMVGERYRELIHAADTIEEMQNTTSSTVNHINSMMTSCKNLHDTHLIGFKFEDHSKTSIEENVNPVKCIAVQTKLLLEIPEKVWLSIENEDFIQATKLFVLARHINTGLQVQVNSKKNVGFVPLGKLVQQQWTSISNLYQTIIQMCKEKLQDVDISVETATSCLVSLYLLDLQTLPELLNTLITQHSFNSLKSTLTFDLTQLLEGDSKVKLKDKIVTGVKIVLKTILLVHSCFVDNNGGTVLEKLNQLFAKDSRPLIENINFSDRQALTALPAVVSEYRLSPVNPLTPLTDTEISTCMTRWNEWVNSFIDEHVTVLLDKVTRVKVLHEIREDAFQVETPPNWHSICASLNLNNVHIWCHYYQPILTKRIQKIIDNRWAKIYETFKTQLLVDLSMDELSLADVNWFVWKDLIGDTVIESRSEVVDVMTGLMKGMWLQDRGVTPTLETLFKTLDSELQKLLDDLKFYLHNKKAYYDDDDSLNQMYSDKVVIEEYLRGATERYVRSILEFIKACLEDKALQTSELKRKTTAIYTARFIQYIPNLMPSLQSSFFNEDPTDVEIKRWDGLCGTLKENCLYCWDKWVDIAMEKVELATSDLPQEFTIEANVDYLMMQWDLIKIQEKDDDDNTVESTIKVPAGPSLKLLQYLYYTSRILDSIVPHTLPHTTHASFIERVALISLTHYNKVVREKESDINQRCALQLLMDVRYLTLLLVQHENKKVMELSHDLCEFLRQKIDPFDYDVFYPHVQVNLKRGVQRVQTLFGSLILNHAQLSGIIGTKLPPSSVQMPNLLGGCSGEARQWFSLLPVAAPLVKKPTDQPKKKPVNPSPNKTRPDITDLMSNTLPINFASARSNAASFFNSMTSDWFSG